MQKLAAPTTTEPPRTRALTFSGQDRDPAASPDGRLVAFASTRDGVSRIWIKQLQGGGEAPLTTGPDRFPRFSPDGSSVLFIRTDGPRRSAYRIGLVGGEPRKLVEDAYQADWSPDGTKIAFLRLRLAQPEAGSAISSPNRSLVGIHELASDREQVLYTAEDRALSGLRVSPDGGTLAFIEGALVLNSRSELVLLDVASGSVRKATAPGNPLGCLVWSGASRIALARAGSALGDGTGSPGRLFLLDPARGSERTLLFPSGLFPLAGTDSRSGSCDTLGPGRLVLDQIEWRMNLSQVALAPGSTPPRPLTTGNSRDRQPAYSPDGSRIVFSSNRSGNLDLWLLETRTGALRQLTDDPAQDWDPGFTSDGHVLWSSDRSGHLEIWIAGSDGGGARQVSSDGVDAENPTATPDGRFIVYTSGNPQKLGLWRVRPDGTDSQRLVSAASLVPESAPQAGYALFVTDGRGGSQRFIRVVEVESGKLVPFEIEVSWPTSASNQILYGRARWTPDGRRIVFIGADAEGRSGVFVQDFVPGRDTSATRRAVTGFAPDVLTESLGVSPDGNSLVVSTLQEYSSLTLAEGLAGLEPSRREGGSAAGATR